MHVSQLGGATTTQSGMSIYGDGSDGDVVVSSNDTLTRDMYYNTLTVNTGVTLKTGGYRIFVRGTLTVVGTGLIDNPGGSGGNASGTTGGTAGSAADSGILGGTPAAGRAGENGSVSLPIGNGAPGIDVSNSIGVDGAASGQGGIGDADWSQPGAEPGGTATAPAASSGGWNSVLNIADCLDITGIAYEGSAGSSSGGLGAGDDVSVAGGAGGGSGAPGGKVWVFAKTVVGAAQIRSTGGNGGNGSDGGSGGGNTGGGGGGGGGSGGVVVLVYNSKDGSPSAPGGAGGSGGAGVGTGGSGNAGSNGNSGVVIEIANE